MGLISRFKEARAQYEAEAEERAKRRLAKARTSADREKTRTAIQREQIASRKQLAEAQTALLKAEAQKKKAAKALKEAGNGRDWFGQVRRMLGATPPKKKRKRTARKRKEV